MTTSMVSPADARAVADKVYARQFAVWAVSGAERADPPVVVALRPPTEAVALRDPAAVASWIATWREAEGAVGAGARIDWETRQWASLGTQHLPVRLRLEAPGAVACFARRTSHWAVATRRAARLTAVLADATSAASAASVALPGDTVAVRAAMARVLPAVVALAQEDVDRLGAVVSWLVGHPASGVFVRQVPVRGVDTKWIDAHRPVVTALVTALTGAPDLGLAKRPRLVRVRFCDPSLAPEGITDLSAPVADLARLACAPRHVLLVENLETLLALPALPGVVAVHGQGYAVGVLGEIAWVRGADVVYWGDLDTDGINILSIARLGVPHTRSVLMDRATLDAHRDLAVSDPKPRRSFAGPLTPGELDAVAALRAAGDTRLEQERIPWERALRELRRALYDDRRQVIPVTVDSGESAGQSTARPDGG